MSLLLTVQTDSDKIRVPNSQGAIWLGLFQGWIQKSRPCQPCMQITTSVEAKEYLRVELKIYSRNNSMSSPTQDRGGNGEPRVPDDGAGTP